MADNNLTVVISSPTIETEIKTNAAINANVVSGARGKSAYESWIDQGNTGSEQDFINALLANYTFVHTQGVAQQEWTINHNLGKYPSVTIVNSVEQVVYGDIEYINTNTLKLSFTAGFSGKAYLN